MKQEEAKRRISDAFIKWRAENFAHDYTPTTIDALSFFQSVVAGNPYLTDFRHSGSTWQHVKSWLVAQRLVR